MADRLFNIIPVVLIVALVPGWLYASGNLPALAPQNKNAIGAVYSSCPQFSDATYVASRCAFETMRTYGFDVPLTLNERLVQITTIKQQTIDICNEILDDK